MKGEEVHCYSGKECRNVRTLRKLEIEEKKDFQKYQFSFIFPRSFSSKTKAEIRVANFSFALGKYTKRIFPRAIPE